MKIVRRRPGTFQRGRLLRAFGLSGARTHARDHDLDEGGPPPLAAGREAMRSTETKSNRASAGLPHDQREWLSR